MRISVQRSGGIGGLRLGGAIDTAELPVDLNRRVDDVMRSDRLEAAAADTAAVPSHSGAADLFQYEVSTPEGSWSVRDGTPDSELFQVLDDIVAQIVRRSRAGASEAEDV